jgi:hypothetical protein
MRRNISALRHYDNGNLYHAFLIGACNFISNDAVDYDNNFDDYANHDNHASGNNDGDIDTVIHGHAVKFDAGNVCFSTGHAGGDANNNKPEHNGNVAVDPVIGLWRQDLQRREDSCICHHPVCRCGGNILRVSSSPTRN